MRTFQPRRCAEAGRSHLAPFVLLAASLLNLALASTALGDEEDGVAFTPRKDAQDVGVKPKKPASFTPEVVKREFSFLRYEGLFRNLCDALSADGRRERVLEVGREVFPKENECLACKALWRTVLAACSPRSERLASRPRRRVTPGSEEQATPTPVAEQHVGERLPSVEVIEAASEISIRMQKDEPGDAPNLMALERVMGRLQQQQGLSPAERDYYSALEQYLCAAWKGR